MGLYREVGLAASTFLVVGNIIGIGIFTTSGLIAGQLGTSPWLIGVWLLGGFLALAGAICYSRLGVLFPHAGGEYAFLRPTFGPTLAFLSGWASLFIGFTAPIAASALGLAYYLTPYLPESFAGGGWTIRIAASASLLLVATLLSVGLKAGNRLHSFVTLLNFLLALGFALAVLRVSPPSENLLPALEGSLVGTSLPALGSAIILVMFTYSGWNAAAYIAEEIKSPGRNIPLALILGTCLVIVLYGLINLAYLSASPLEEISGHVAVAEVTAAAVFGAFGRNLVNVLILFSIVSSLTAMSIAGPRVYYAMARDGLFPRWLSDVHPGRKIPIRAIWFQTGVALCLVSVGDLYRILLYSGFTLMLFSTLTVAALFKVTRYRVLPSIFIGVNVTVLVSAAVSDPWEAAAGLVTVLLGVPVYLYFARRLVVSG